jgi:hypothetical protein
VAGDVAADVAKGARDDANGRQMCTYLYTRRRR